VSAPESGSAWAQVRAAPDLAAVQVRA
jgi:hypothetical protein